MGKSQSKLRIVNKKRNIKPNKYEHCKYEFQNEGTADSREEQFTYVRRIEEGTDDCPKEDDTDDSCNMKDESIFFYGTNEILLLECGEADLHKHLVGCKKNPGHKLFLPVDTFNTNHLPEGHNDNDLFEYIKTVAELTVRVAVEMTSTERPEFLPDTNQPYPFYDKRGSNVLRLGTGMVRCVNKLTEDVILEYNMGSCKCDKCQLTDTPSKVWGEVWMSTSTHVVFDDLEARNTTCRLFYDRQDSPLVTLNGWTVVRTNIEEDTCVFKCLTCDIDLLDKLDKLWWHWDDLCDKLNNKYTSSKDKKLTFIVSHPHGCPKQISVGHLINRFKVSDDMSMCTYTTCTCPGSSGAYVHSLGYDDWLYCGRHVHSGVNSKGINYSGISRFFH